MILDSLTTFGQIKSYYTPYENSADTIKNISISEYQLDSIRYEVLYYKDLLEETIRQNSISQKVHFADTVYINSDSMVINCYSRETILLLKKVYEYENNDTSSYFLNEDYFLINGKISYRSRSIIGNLEVTESKGKKENFGRITQLHSRSRYVYDNTGIIDKVVVEFRIGGSGIRLLEFKNEKKINQQNFHLFPNRKISIWEFWD